MKELDEINDHIAFIDSMLESYEDDPDYFTHDVALLLSAKSHALIAKTNIIQTKERLEK